MRTRYAFDHGCDLAMMVAQSNSDSQRTAERKGFHRVHTHKMEAILLNPPAWDEHWGDQTGPFYRQFCSRSLVVEEIV
jgi:hypothetical protein